MAPAKANPKHTDIIFGTLLNDQLVGGNKSDVIFGLAGHDKILQNVLSALGSLMESMDS